jgi:peroxiredoxin
MSGGIRSRISVAFVFALTAASAQASELTERYSALVARWESEERAKPRPDLQAYAPQFLALAKASPKSPAARDALLWIIGMNWFHAQSGPLAEVNDEAMALLVEHHAEDPIVGAAGMRLINAPTPGRERYLRALVERSQNREAKGRGAMALAEYLKMKAANARGRSLTPGELEARPYQPSPYFLTIVASPPAPILQEAEQYFEEVIARYADVLFVGGGRSETMGHYKKLGMTLGARAEGMLKEMRSLRIGQAAPDIVGEGPDGKSFRLSDYRGKVVALTFSGNWCGPCVQMYPAERALVERLTREPFALLSVNTDESVETLRDAISKGEITWRCWWDGPPGGPICEQWNVQGFPTVLVIDQKGVIRLRQVGDEGLEELVLKLLAESKQKP